MNYLKISLGILLVLAASRFIPHPPNFTSLIALSFYVPTFFGLAYLPSVILSFLITDLFIGMHNLSFFTWGSVFLIGLCSKYFLSTIYTRFLGVITGALIFFIITNFGVWITGGYGYTFSGLIGCYFMAIPFFYNTIISTLIFSSIIEILYFCFKKSIKFKHSL